MGVNTKSFDNASDMITFSRASGAYGLTKVGYGSELVTNGTFDTGIEGWRVWTYPHTPVISYDSLNQRLLFTTAQYGTIRTTIPVVAGVTYRFTYTTDASFWIADVNGNDPITGTVIHQDGESLYWLATSTRDIDFVVQGRLSGSNQYYVDNVSVKEVTYNSSDPSSALELIYHPNDVPRIEYNTDGTSKGLLVEESRTNSITNSESCSFVDQSGGTVTASTTPAPYGMSSTVKRVQSSTFNGGGRLPVTILTAGNSYCSVYVRSRTGADQNLKITASGTSAATQVAPASGDWVRLGKVALFGAGSRDMRVLSTGDTIDLDIALPQVELGSFPTSYIKTTGATATRSADVASIPVADFGYNQGAGTLFVEAAPAALSSKNIFNLNVSGIDSESIYSNPDSSGHLIVRDTTTQVNLDAGSFVPNQTSKLAVVIKANDFAACLDSGNVVKDSAGTVPSPISNMHIGSTAPQSGIYSGHIKSIKYYPRRLTDAQLQELTT
ncbi:hypothetical protein N9V70_01010 [Candidatus Pelagibacter bacterium]|nr:hypothetical protein [Candidatus Pelagibacter bacterium]